MVRHISRGMIAAAFVAVAGPALAADIAWRKAAPPESVYSWTGLYVGANIGLGVSDTPTNYNIVGPLAQFAFPAFDAGTGSLIGGAQIGYNYQIGDIMIGAEADFQGSTQGSNGNCVFACIGNSGLNHTTDLPWFGTVRGRIGTVTGPFMLYYTAGFAYGDVKTQISETFGTSGTFNFTETRFGWTIGSGTEVALGGNWTGRLEYLYVDLGTTSNTFVLNNFQHTYSTDVRQHVFRGGLNYRFGPEGQVPPPLMQPKRWTGLYVGGNFGNSVGRNPASLRVGGFEDTFDFEPSGWFGGVQAGYNWQFLTNYVLGMEVDFQGSNQKSDQNCALSCTWNVNSARLTQTLPWWGTVRGRLGYTVGPALFYVAGGFAYGNVKTEITETLNTLPVPTSGAFSSNQTLTGWTFGGGVETPVGKVLNWDFRDWTIRGEYLYVDLGNSVTNYTLANFSNVLVSDVRNHVFRTSINYLFSTP